MRTTVTLDDDLAAQLKRRARERDVPFKAVLNEAVRAGLQGGTRKARPYRMKPSAIGLRATGSLNRLADELESDEVARKLEQGR